MTGALAHNFWTKWIFDQHGIDSDISRLALITPKEMKITFASHGPNVPAPTVHNEGEWTIREWRTTKIAALPLEMDEPGGNDTLDWIDMSTLTDWSQVVSWYSDLAASACTPDDSITAKAKELTAASKSPSDKIAAIVRYVRSLRYQSTPFRLSAYVPTDGKQVVRERYGDCKDKAALICSLLKSVGLDAEMILLSPRDIGTTAYLPSTRFDHAIARIHQPDGSWQWVDATADQMPLGNLPYVDQGVPALVVDNATTSLATSPEIDPADDGGGLEQDLTVDPDGAIRVKMAMHFTGNLAWVMRSWLRRLQPNQHDAVLASVASEITPGAVSDGGTFEGIDDPDGKLTITVDYHADNYAATAGNLMLLKLPGSQLGGSPNDLLVKGRRTTPIETNSQRGIRTTVTTIHLPAGYVPDSMQPEDTVTSKWADYKITRASAPGKVTVTRTLRISALRIPLADAPDYVAFMRKCTALSSLQIAIKKQ